MLKMSYMARAQDHESYDGLVAYAKDIRLDAIDFHVMGELQNIDFLRKLKFQCLRAGLPIGYFASGVSLVGPHDQRGDRLARAKADTDSASFVGALRIRGVVGTLSRRGSGKSYRATRARRSDSFSRRPRSRSLKRL